MNSTSSTHCKQVLTKMGYDPDNCFLLGPGPLRTRVKYEIERVHKWKANVRRNDRPIATLQWGLFGGLQLEMVQGGQRTSQEQTPRKVRWEGRDYLYAIHLEKDRVVATFDPREQTIELKSWIELESDVDIVNELVATWGLYARNVCGAWPEKWPEKSTPPTRPRLEKPLLERLLDNMWPRSTTEILNAVLFFVLLVWGLSMIIGKHS
ncbi:unnamed protein product [Rhizoctonia solani]|uniref:Uncharacterized protein n=1 Tax=Rhizoctonia solani TaxID=456999 RepID=A0A8H3ADJ3_9AGAM|nr:unnamed protein product [Rhizoctonia solani]